MLRTFDENLVITAVQQLTTDLDSLSGRIKKLEEGGSASWKQIAQRTYENVTITANNNSYDTIKLPEGFLLTENKIMVLICDYKSDEPQINKLEKNIFIITNLNGKVSGSITTGLAVLQYYDSTGTLSQAYIQSGLTIKAYYITDEEVSIKATYSATQTITNATIDLKIYELALPS